MVFVAGLRQVDKLGNTRKILVVGSARLDAYRIELAQSIGAIVRHRSLEPFWLSEDPGGKKDTKTLSLRLVTRSGYAETI